MNQSLNGSSYARSMNGLNSINADSIDTSTLVCTELDTVALNATGLSTLNNLNVQGYANVSGDLNCYSNVIIDTPGKYLEFPDGSKQTTAAIAQGVGVVRGYLNGYSTQDQLNISTSAYNTMTFNMVDSHNQIDISGNSKIVFQKTAAYLIIISVQVKKDDAGDDDVYFWLAKNGVDIADSNTLCTLSKNGDVDVLTVNFGSNFVAGDYVEWRWFSQDPNLYLHYDTATTINGVALPATPSVILTVEETNSIYNSLQSVDISGNLFVTGDLDVSGNITGHWNISDLHLTGDLSVDGTSHFIGDVDMSNNLTVGGTTTLDLLNVNTINIVGDFDIENANVTNLTADNATINMLTATTGTITNLTSNNITTGQIESTSGDIGNLTSTTATIDTLTSRIGSFSNTTNMVPVETQLNYPGAILYHDYNPMTLQTTSGWTYLIYTTTGTINKNLTYAGIDNFTCYFAVVGGGGGGAGGGTRNNTSPTANNTSGGSGGGGSSALIISNTSGVTMANGKYFNISTIGVGGTGGNGGISYGSLATTGGPGSSGGTTTVSTNITGSVYSATNGLGGLSPTDPAGNMSYIRGGHGALRFTVGSAPSTQYYGYGGGTVTGTTTNYPGGYLAGDGRSGGYGGSYYDDNLSDTSHYYDSLSINATFADGTNFVQRGGYDSVGLSPPINQTYFYGRGGGGGSGRTQKIGANYVAFQGGAGGQGCFMLYFQTSQMTQVPTYSLSTKGFYNTSYTIPNFDSGWFAATSNTAYSLIHNLNLTIQAPPILFVYFTATLTPTAPIFIVRCNGLINNNTTNYNSGIGKEDLFTDPNVFTFSTEENALYYSTGGTNLRYDTGYLRVIIRY